MIEPANSNLRANLSAQAALARGAVLFYLLGVVALAALSMFEASILAWARARNWVGAELLWLLRIAACALAVVGIGTLVVSMIQRVFVSQSFGALSSTNSRLRAYAFVVVAIGLFVLPLYLARV